MSNCWMREVRLSSSVPNYGNHCYIKFLALFLEKVVGYTFISETVNTGSYRTYEKNGTGGAFAGSTFVFTRSGGDSTFAVTDVGKWILIKDATNPVNSGWYKIVGYTDANTISIDFRSLPTEYPVAASSLSWWLMAEAYSIPSVDLNSITYQTPHADAWQINIQSYNGNGTLWVTVALDGNFSSGKVLGGCYFKTSYTGGGANLYMYALANTEGSMLHFFCYAYDTKTGYCGLTSVLPITPYDTGHVNTEKWGLFGKSGADNSALSRSSTDFGLGRIWLERKRVQRNAYMLDWSLNGAPNAFVYGNAPGQSGTDLNSRLNKNEFFVGTPIVLDPNNASEEFEMYGVVSGHYTLRGGGFVALTPMKRLVDRDVIYLNNGIALDWPSVTPQF